MGLSGLDSKKCQTILAHKSTTKTPDIPLKPIISSSPTDDNKKFDEYGEVVILSLKEPHKEFTCIEVDKMVEAYQSGKTTIQLAEEYGCCKTTVAKLLKQRGVNVTKSKAMAKLDDAKVIAMYAEMHTTEEIARYFKVNPQAILKCLRNHGIKIRSRWDYVKNSQGG